MRNINRTARILAPIVEPIDNARRTMNKNTICTLTCLSTAVRLIGAALRDDVSDSQGDVYRNLRCIPHKLCVVASKYNQSI